MYSKNFRLIPAWVNKTSMSFQFKWKAPSRVPAAMSSIVDWTIKAIFSLVSNRFAIWYLTSSHQVSWSKAVKFDLKLWQNNHWKGLILLPIRRMTWALYWEAVDCKCLRQFQASNDPFPRSTISPICTRSVFPTLSCIIHSHVEGEVVIFAENKSNKRVE